MKQLLFDNMAITDQDLQHLADGRTNVVCQWLSGQVARVRLFVVASMPQADDIKDSGKMIRVDLPLK